MDESLALSGPILPQVLLKQMIEILLTEGPPHALTRCFSSAAYKRLSKMKIPM